MILIQRPQDFDELTDLGIVPAEFGAMILSGGVGHAFQGGDKGERKTSLIWKSVCDILYCGAGGGGAETVAFLMQTKESSTKSSCLVFQ